METNGFASQNGFVATNGNPNVKPPRVRTRPPTVEEALPYSPFSSVVPFNSDVVPIPTIGAASSASLFSNSTERDAARQGLDILNCEVAQSTTSTTVRLQQTLQDLRQLLQPPNISNYAFKVAPNPTPNNNSTPLPKMSLSPFSKMLYDAVNPEYTYPSPETPSIKLPKKQVVVQKLKKGPSVTPHAASNRQAFRENSTLAVEIPVKKTTHQSITPPQPSPFRSSQGISVVVPSHRPDNWSETKSSQAPSPNPVRNDAVVGKQSSQQLDLPVSKPVSQFSQYNSTPTGKANSSRSSTDTAGSNPNVKVLISTLPASFRPDEFIKVADLPSPKSLQDLSRKSRQSLSDGPDDQITITHDQRQKSQMAFDNLNDFLRDIFEIQDQQQPPEAMTSTHLFTATNDGVGLSDEAQVKAERYLLKVIELDRFSQVPLDDLLRLQKLCENAVKDAESMDVKVDENMAEAEVDNLLHQLPIAELGLKSARTSLRLMAGGREDKQLYSEDAIQASLNTLKNVIETCIIPIVEMRSSGSSAASFKLLSAQKKNLTNLLSFSRRLLSLLATIVSKIELSETVINTLEFTASQLIFVENAQNEKDSILGIGKFDGMRVVAMDVLAQIFMNNEAQRQGIFHEILSSLEKLPVNKQGARQFKLTEGGSIQLVSALIMKLVQTSASKAENSKEDRRVNILRDIDERNDDNEPNSIDPSAKQRYTITSEERAERQAVTAIQELTNYTSPLHETARINANHVVTFIVNRAMSSTKSGDAPYRNLLDLFVADFITCLRSTDWPAAELLLRLLLYRMVQLAESDKTPAPAKNMALDLLGSMGAAISELLSHVRKMASTLDTNGSDLARYLSSLAQSSLENKEAAVDLVSWETGPFRISLDFLNARGSSDPQLSSAIGFYMTEWATKISESFELIDESDPDYRQVESEYGRLAYRLRMMISDKRWLDSRYEFSSIDPSHARLAYSLTLLNSKFCKSFSRVLTILLGSMSSEQATVRSKSMKSVNQVLDTDPSILDREPAVQRLLLKCLNDTSVLVRDSALGLIGRCIELKPALENDLIESILERVNDSGVGVRKRAMKLSKEIYLRNKRSDVRSSIANALLHRVNDQDEGVQELARQAVEEVWMSPFYQPATSDNTSAQFKLAMAEHVALMVRTVHRGHGVSTVLDKVLHNILSSDSKLHAANFRVCKALVATMFETIIDNSNTSGNNAPSARDALQILTIFAKSNAQLFTAEQVQLLQPYIANVNVNDDLAVYLSVVIIFRHVLPHLSAVHNSFLISVRGELLRAMSRMSKLILDHLVACLWIISKTLEDYQHLTKAVYNSLDGITKLSPSDLTIPDKRRKLNKLLLISGVIGKHCDLDSQVAKLSKLIPGYQKGDSVSKLMTDAFAPFATAENQLEVRQNAFDAIGMVCQSWPKNFRNANIECLFKEVFNDETHVLEIIIMSSFKEFMLLEEKRSEAGGDDSVGVAAEGVAKLGVMGGGQGDGVANAIALVFLPAFTRIALASKDDEALLAVELIASIGRQGLVHPKDCGIAMMILESSPNSKIANIAFHAHRALHEKHETMLEREYIRAVTGAYEYQRDVVLDIHGATLDPFQSKLSLMIEVMKISKVSSRKKFFKRLAMRIDFDPEKMDSKELPHHLELAQFIIENMAFFEYASVDELLATIEAMEKVASGPSIAVAAAIEHDILHIRLDQPIQINENGLSQPVTPPIDSERLMFLTASSMMLSCLWEARTYLRRQYGLMAKSKAKAIAKDLNRAPIKNPSVNGDKFWEAVSVAMSACESEEAMMRQCRAFVDMLNVDQDFKIAAEGDGDDGRLNTPSEDEGNGTPDSPGTGRGRKRKAGGGTPGGRKKRARSTSAQHGRIRQKGSGKRASIDAVDSDEF